MKVAAVTWDKEELKKIRDHQGIIDRIKKYIEEAVSLNIELLVFPAFTGCLYDQLRYNWGNLGEIKKQANNDFFLEMQKLSKTCEMIICPGSYWERDGENIFHTSNLLLKGKTLLKQRQLYLARWERKIGLSRGKEARMIEYSDWKIGIVLATDVFYPMVSRWLALKGADLVLSPVGFRGIKNEARQVAGIWREVQQNLFFAVESGFNGTLFNMEFWADSIIHAPLEMTLKDDGILVRSNFSKGLIYSHLNRDERKRAINRFNVLKQLNPDFYINYY